MAAIQSSREVLEGRIGEVRSDVILLRQDLRNVADRVTDTDTKISELEDTVSTLRKEASTAHALVKEVAWRVEDAENRARRNNLRFVGFPEGQEGSRCDIFLKDWLLKTFTLDQFATCFITERAHRALSGRPLPGATP